ncbi:hydroxymethylbilane synthase [Legionella londiniensis]|uniref:Porphobilinogen deaminase n=1 Tax=Legionella londiniensis TaxID=45068 RepID=A0A0W0VS50_9GAMM|nr:hydroxymethylbilane synthase [Legionella londiniensis]KTD23060.1 porphobilinogen deaminase [Legionella londiniensis]STX94077.1 porphobilinogen deaminase [Legionella londiniensis]
MTQRILRIATRESPLALWQANHVGELLKEYWPTLQIELLPMKTSGDKFLKDKLFKIGGKGLFTKELEDALLDKRADLAVHSMKDVPAAFPQGLTLKAICKRHNPFDAFVSIRFANLDALPSGSVIGTSSLRRQSQLLAVRPDLRFKTLRGNINTRLRKLEEQEYDAIILAVSGLERMGMQQLITEQLDEETMLPACGQGALGIECRENDEELHHLIAPLNNPLSALCVRSERIVARALGGNCHTPLAVFCKPTDDSKLLLRAKILAVDGSKVLSSSQRGDIQDAEKLAKDCAESLLADGARELIEIPYEDL